MYVLAIIHGAASLQIPTRRQLLTGAGASLVAPAPAWADKHDVDELVAAPASSADGVGRSGLLLLPPVTPLRNSRAAAPESLRGTPPVAADACGARRRLPPRYTWVRAAEDELEATGVISTNPAFKMAVSNSLTAKGQAQAIAAANELKKKGVTNPLIWYRCPRPRLVGRRVAATPRLAIVLEDGSPRRRGWRRE